MEPSSGKISDMKQQIESKQRDLVANKYEKEAIYPPEDPEAEIKDNTHGLDEIDNSILICKNDYKTHKFPGQLILTIKYTST